MKRIDLLTEVFAPVIAGILLSLELNSILLSGFMLVAFWNVCSFIPELILLRSVFISSAELKTQSVLVSKERTGLVFAGILSGWREFFAHPVALSMVAYSCLWFSVLSPHGVLLTSFLKGSWKVSEPMLGIFRAAGAVFGLTATFLFPLIRRRIGLTRATALFIQCQAVAVVLALVFFFAGSLNGAAFLLMVLFSRIGLYGFSIGEGEIRQLNLADGMRGKISGVATALNSVATLFIFALGSFLPSHEQFFVLVIASVCAVVIGSVLFQLWTRRAATGMEATQPEQ
jgi:iron-regulated transporter 1